MKKLIIIWLTISLLSLSACTAPRSPDTSPVRLPETDFSRFSLIRLMPTSLPELLSKQTASRKSAAQLDRELVIRLSKNLQRQKIAPTNDNHSKSMLNVIPYFETHGRSLVLVVIFQDNASGKNVVTQMFTVSNTWESGFKYSDTDRVLLARLAQQVVNYMVSLQ